MPAVPEPLSSGVHRETHVYALRPVFAALFLHLGWGIPVGAADYHLDDGSVVRAAFVGEAQGVLTLLNEDGKAFSLERARIREIDDAPRLPEKIEKKARAARRKFIENRRREAVRLIRDHGRRPRSREEIERALEDYREPEILPALVRGLSSKKAATRA